MVAKGSGYDVEMLVVSEGRQGEDGTVREEYVRKVMERANKTWCDEDGVDEKWETVRSALVTTAEEVLGPAGCSQPDWFRDSIDKLKPLLAIRNTGYSRGLFTLHCNAHLRHIERFHTKFNLRSKVHSIAIVATHLPR